MDEHFINLNCANCGAKLDVYDDMERFSCGYCGTELIVQRRGGTVALKSVTEAIGRVQVGTDKTAAELALVRLDQESITRDEELKKLTAEYYATEKRTNDKTFAAFIFAGLLGFVGILTTISGFQSQGDSFAIFFGLLMVGGSLAWIIAASRTSNSDQLASAEKQILDKQAEIAEVKRRMVEQRRIVDS